MQRFNIPRALFLLFLQALQSYPQVSIPNPAVGQTPSGSTPLLILPPISTSATDSPFLTRAFRDRSSQQLSGVRVCGELGSRNPGGATLPEPAHGVDPRPAA